MIKSIPLNTIFHSPKYRVTDNAKRLITLTNLSHFKQVVGNVSPFHSLPTHYVDQYSIDMQVNLDCITSCLEWVCRVNNLNASQLRVLAIVNIMAGVLYESDQLNELALKEIEHVHNHPHELNTRLLERISDVQELTQWDRPSITLDEGTAVKAIAPNLTAAYLDKLAQEFECATAKG